MTYGTHYLGSPICIAIIAMVLLVASLAVNAVLVLQPGSRHYTCSDFGSYEDALAAYRGGAGYLDGYPKNGIPCEDLYRKSHHV